MLQIMIYYSEWYITKKNMQLVSISFLWHNPEVSW